MAPKKSQSPTTNPEEEPERVPLAASSSEVEEYKEKWQRVLAEMENMRKRYESERQLLGQFAIAGFVEDLLPVVDNFYRATEHVPDEQKSSSWVTGIQYIQKNLLDILEQRGVKEIITKTGDPFDPTKHEAIGTVVNDQFKEDHIVEVKNRGYLLGDRILRPVQVIVSQGSSPE